MCLYMQEHSSLWSDSSFPHPADALYILLVLFILSLKLMMDFFVLGWFCGFSTGTIMGWDAAFQECFKPLPTGAQTHPFSLAVRGGCRQHPAPGRPWSLLLGALCCQAGDGAAAPACCREPGVCHINKANVKCQPCKICPTWSVRQHSWGNHPRSILSCSRLHHSFLPLPNTFSSPNWKPV